MSFFPTYRDNWTRTPNVFFDEILKMDGVTLNEVRIIGYLIRKTLGYNKEAKWIGITRKELIDKAGVPNSRIKNALDNCFAHGWILHYEEGEGTKLKRYIFLNDERNTSIVKGLELGYFTVDHLQYLNDAGIEKLLESYGLNENKHSSPETGEENNRSSPETGEVKGSASPETGEVTTPETGEANKASSQKNKGVVAPLNTNNKYNKRYKDKSIYDRNSKLPKAIQKQMNGETSDDISAEELLEKQERLKDKLKYMEERLSGRSNENSRN